MLLNSFSRGNIIALEKRGCCRKIPSTILCCASFVPAFLPLLDIIIFLRHIKLRNPALSRCQSFDATRIGPPKCVCLFVCVCVCVSTRIDPPKRGSMMCVCVCVCVFIKLHITAQSGLVILVILCHSR